MKKSTIRALVKAFEANQLQIKLKKDNEQLKENLKRGLRAIRGLDRPLSYKREGKPRYTLLTSDMLDPQVRVLEKGAKKHGERNYLTNPAVTDDDIVSALLRHAMKMTTNPQVRDEETGEYHAAHVGANVAMLLDRWAKKEKK